MVDWPSTTIGEIFDIGSGKTMSSKTCSDVEPAPFLRTSNVFWDRIDLSKVDEMPMLPWEREEKSLLPGDLLVCEGGEIGRAAVWDGQAEGISFQNHLHRLRRKSDEVDPGFYAYFLQAAFTQLGIYEGAGNKTTIPNLSRNRLAALDVPKPDYHEQCDIRSVLKRARAAMDLADDSIRVAAELKRAAMRELFTCGLRGEAQKECETGSVPKSWELIRIDGLGHVVTGNTPPTKDRSNYDGGDIPFIAPGDIEHGRRTNNSEKYVSITGMKSSRPLPKGSTCFVCIGSTIGKVGMTTAELSCTNQQINSVMPSGDFDPGYVFHLLTFWSDHIKKQQSPSPVPIMSKGVFEANQIWATTRKDEQREMAAILDGIDGKIDLHKRKKAVLEELFRALLHSLMTGEIRVADLDLSALGTFETEVAA